MQEVIKAASQPVGGDKPVKKSGGRLKTMEVAPPAPDVVAVSSST